MFHRVFLLLCIHFSRMLCVQNRSNQTKEDVDAAEPMIEWKVISSYIAVPVVCNHES